MNDRSIPPRRLVLSLVAILVLSWAWPSGQWLAWAAEKPAGGKATGGNSSGGKAAEGGKSTGKKDAGKEKSGQGKEAEGEGEAEGGDEQQEDQAKAGASASAEEPSFEKLLELNGPQIFGGTVKVDGESLEILFNADGQMKIGFEGKGIIDSKSEEMKGANRKFIQKGDKKDQGKEKDKEQLVPGLCGIGMGDGQWTSRFPIKSDVWIEVGFRVPNILTPQSSFRLSVNWDRGTGYETNFFQSVAYVSKGSPKGLWPNVLPDCKGHPAKWFPRKGDSVKVEFGLRGGQCLLRLKDKDAAAFPKATDKGGKIFLFYSKLLFTLDNLKITGKMDRAWCEKEIETLKRQGKLKLKEERKEAKPGEGLGL